MNVALILRGQIGNIIMVLATLEVNCHSYPMLATAERVYPCYNYTDQAASAAARTSVGIKSLFH